MEGTLFVCRRSASAQGHSRGSGSPSRCPWGDFIGDEHGAGVLDRYGARHQQPADHHRIRQNAHPCPQTPEAQVHPTTAIAVPTGSHSIRTTRYVAANAAIAGYRHTRAFPANVAYVRGRRSDAGRVTMPPLAGVPRLAPRHATVHCRHRRLPAPATRTGPARRAACRLCCRRWHGQARVVA